MGRSLKLKQDCIPKAKQAVKRMGYPTQQILAEDLSLARSTISQFLNGKPVDNLNFYEICGKLGLDDQEVVDWNESETTFIETPDNNQEISETDFSKYIDRPPLEEICCKEACKPGSLLRIKSSKGMGKTLLVNKILSQIDGQQYRIIKLNFLEASQTIIQDLDKLLNWFSLIISKQLGLLDVFKQNWEGGLGLYSCTSYVEDHILLAQKRPLILVLEHIDQLFPYQATADEFLSLFRVWNEKGVINETWKKLHLILSYSTENYVPADLNHSPFNVGIEIELKDFTPEQVLNLAYKYDANLKGEDLQIIINLVGGNPYLVNKAIYALTQKQISLTNFEETATTEEGIYQDHLRGHLLNLQNNHELAEAMKKVVTSSSPVDLGTNTNWKLHSLGLVTFDKNAVKSRYKLYADYLSKRLV
ncbi:AAA-like domain-containing protein [Crocosphaera sp.]|uniref:AAA-like domain-containing protein n=1 Tax=Crocosphaera sp. TaxID=2729996 RepID=UPI003F21D93F|nr:AAA-like domain-containing protein [Crocosphaera sp.]